jgi:maltooligosyltrehalose trehalohydrolase
VRTAHELGLMVFLDVVYNHFGPDGNYLHLYAPGFFTERHHTPWGAGIDFDGESSRTVRDFFVHNALYWLSEYRFDGLRLDAVHAIADASDPHILVELAEAVQAGPGRERHVHLVLENDHNAARYLERRRDGSPRWYAAQWNDDFHHALHLLTTGEGDGYYMDYADHPAHHLGRSLTEGNAYQGEHSAFRDGAPRGEPSAHLPPTAFVDFLQNHDQAGNRAFGERIDALAPPAALRAALTVLLLAPAPPLLFMGQEFMPRSPFLFFCDFGDALAEAVTNGRRREFRRFGRFADPEAQASIPDPNDPDTFRRSGLHWQDLDRESHRDWLTLHRELLALRRREIVPRLRGIRGGAATFRSVGPGGLRVQWRLGDGVRLTLIANLSAHPLAAPGLAAPAQGHLLRAEPGTPDPSRGPEQPPWAAAWYLEPAGNVPGAGRNRHPRAPWSGSA